jgi:excisionase family DNA binding protein
MAKLNEYLTVGEAAEFVGVSKDTLRRWDRAGKLTARRHPITGYRLYLRRELEQLLAQTEPPKTETRNKKKGGRK